MNNKRPIHLDLTTLHFPVMAICSIMHRLSGVIIFLLLPWMLFLLQKSLHSYQSFHELQLQLQYPLIKLLLWGFLSALTYHFMAGIRHMMADLGWGEQLHVARRSAIYLLILSTLVIIGLGVWIW